MLKKSIVLLFVVCLLLSSTTVLAGMKHIPSAALNQKLSSVNSMISGIEAQVSRIESQKMVMVGDAENLEKQMYSYAQEMKAALDVALTEAKQAADSKGNQGSVGSLESFEQTAKSHEQKTAVLETKLKNFEGQIKNGQIKLDKSLLQKMSPAEREEFHNFLTPAAQKEIKNLHPELFKQLKQLKTSSLSVGALMSRIERSDIPGSVGEFCSSMPERISDFIVSPAEASLAAPCVGLCIAQNWGGCVGCVVSASPAAVTAWNNFVGCWNGACGCHWYSPWCCAKKGYCLAVLIAKLA